MNAAEAHRVFAYGSNMDQEDLARWMDRRGFGEPRIHAARPAVLPGFRLVWNYHSRARDGGAANVEAHPEAELPGLVLEVDANTLAAIDAKEGHPNVYCRGDCPLPVRLFGGALVDAWVYVVTETHRQPSPVWPKRAYLDLLINGSLRHQLPDAHLALLRSIPTSD